MDGSFTPFLHQFIPSRQVASDETHTIMYTLRKKSTSKGLFLCFSLIVTNRGLYSVPEGQMVSGATMIGIWGPDGLI